MQFRHILAQDVEYADAVLLDNARAVAYDGITPEQFGRLVLDRIIDLWRLEGGPHFIMATSFLEDVSGRILDVNFGAGELGTARHIEEMHQALWTLVDRLACYKVQFTTARPAFAQMIGATEVARIYEIPRPRS